MERGLTGRYEVRTIGGERVRSFMPYPLPPSPALDLSGKRQLLLEKALLSLGRLDSISTLLPDPHLFLYSYLRREAVLSSQIEGTQSSLADLLLFEMEEAPGVPLDDVVEVSNYVTALEHGVARLRDGFPLSNRLMREIHSSLLSRGRGSDKSPGEFRRSQNWIGGTRPGNASFVPPPHQQVEGCMAELERFIHDRKSALPALVKAALAHVQFETIHPFLDGNGRVGRLLIVLMLQDAGILGQPLLYLSLYFKQNRRNYYRLLNRVRMHGDWESWIDYFLKGVESISTSAVETARNLVGLFGDDSARIKGMGRSSGSALLVFETLRRQPLISLNDLCASTGLTFPTVAKAMAGLSELGIARELTGRKRNRIFVYDRYLSILSEGTEPL
ncbi:MAG: Fic family protein [Actinobacteria bacterium]|jgi:Fic family protein|nr:MAG: Fic family protein [Actinomycetota bacterium]